MKVDISGTMKRFSGAMIQPVMFLAVGGIVLALAAILRMTFMPAAVITAGDFIYNLMMNGFINNLAVVFCVGLTCSLAKKNKGDAAVIGIVSFLVFLHANNLWLQSMGNIVEADVLYGTGQAMVLGVQVEDMGVFGAVIIGCLNGWLFNKLCDVKFPDAVRIYGGTRLVFIASIVTSALVGIAACYVWPTVASGLSALQGFIENSGNIGLFVYGLLNRLLIPTGLHHLVYMPFIYSNIGGTAEIAGQVQNGAAMIYMAEMGNAGSLTSIDPSIKYMVFGFSKIFGSIGCVLAFINTALPERKADAKAMLLPAMFTAVIAGITEPLEFMYLFVSPLLFVVHSILDGLFQVILIVSGYAMSCGSLIDIVTGALVLPASVSHWYMIIPVGLAAIAAWFLVFRTLILKLDLKTPGREDAGKEIDISTMNASTAKKATRSKKDNGIDQFGDVQDLIDGLGGPDNITGALNCFTRLRVDLKNMEMIDEDIINKFENKGIVRGNNNVQIIIGMKVQDVFEAFMTKLDRTIE